MTSAPLRPRTPDYTPEQRKPLEPQRLGTRPSVAPEPRLTRPHETQPVVDRRVAPTSSTPATTPAGANGGSGWLRDLLNRASEEEGRRYERGNATATDMLAPLSAEIAQAIDPVAASELWMRYRRGERNIFSQALYTPRGRRTFDDVQIKYNREPEFRSSVDRYIVDFENLLRDVSRTDRDGTASESYLLSETGKVYTLLAHAAGQFG